MQKDPSELNNVFNDPAYAEIVPALRTELRDLQLAVDDEPYFKEDDL